MKTAISSVAFEVGLPVNEDAERFVLGSVLLSKGERFADVAALITKDEFALEKHRRIWQRMTDLFERGEVIDRITVANELIRHNELESVDGLTYLVSLDDGLPELENVDHYCRIIAEHARSRRIARIGQTVMNKALFREPSADVIEYGFSQLLALSDPAEKAGLAPASSIVETYPGGVNAFLTPSKHEIGLKSGFIKLDAMTGGLHPGELIILAARPSMGKTALAMQIAEYSARRGTCSAVFSLEMSRESLLQRLVCSRARVDLHQFRGGYLNERERVQLRQALAEIHASPLYIDDTAKLGLVDLHSKLWRLKAERDIGLVVVDYLQLMQVSGKSTRNEDVSELSRGLKLLAKELGIPLIALSQLSRATETRPGDHRPMLADLRDSGSLEQDADLVGFIFREEVYKREREDLHGLAELILAKQRNGPIGRVDLIFLHGQVRFENRAEDLGEFDAQGE